MLPAVSTAPICAAGAGLWVRVTPGASVALPVASLVCDALGPTGVVPRE